LLVAFVVSCALCLAACVRTTRPIVKIGLVAPFEGYYRDVGYEVIYAVRLAVREANARGGVAGHTVELVALDDGGDPAMATEQALKLATDPLIMGVIGHWLDETTSAAAPAYAQAGMPLLATGAGELPTGTLRLWRTVGIGDGLSANVPRCPLPCGWLEGAEWLKTMRADHPELGVAGPGLWAFAPFAALAGDDLEGAHLVSPAPLPAQSSDPSFAERYFALSNGVQPGAYAVLAYDAANTLFAALEASTDVTRASVAEALPAVMYAGLSGPISFDAQGEWAAARPRVYQWRDGLLVEIFFQ
jgi:ABC-type branched-subunit amino acid transport system substrate-binding protein